MKGSNGASVLARSIVVAGAAIVVAAGCGGGKGTADGAAGGATATGSAGAGGSSTGGGAGGSAASTCVNAARTNLEDCTEFAPTGAVITPERAVPGDGGIYLPGGELALPAGGTVIDGDYDLVRAAWGTEMRRTRRTIRISKGGTFFEWVIDQDDFQLDGGTMHYRFNTTMSASGTTLYTTAIGCGGSLSDSFGYTAAGDELDLFNLNSDGLFVYKRNCTRR